MFPIWCESNSPEVVTLEPGQQLSHRFFVLLPSRRSDERITFRMAFIPCRDPERVKRFANYPEGGTLAPGQQLNLSDKSSRGDGGVLKDGGNLDWPASLKEAAFDKRAPDCRAPFGWWSGR